ncbi:MAG: DUF5615 family PIN-like protein [Acidobacteriota bacterium]
MDENVNGAITAGLRARGVDLLTVQEDDRSGIPDASVLDRATQLGRCLVTHDVDFLTEVHLRPNAGQSFVGVVYAHPNRIGVGECIRDLELIAEVGDPESQANRIEYLPL